MRKIILVNGIIAGVIVSVMLLISIPLHTSGVLNMDIGMLVGYTSMVIALSTVFFGIKTYRDQYENGTIAFWQAIKIGMLIVLVAGVIYGITWEVYFSFKGEEFIEYYTDNYINNMKEDGATAEEVTAAKAKMDEWNDYYRNPFVRFAWTLFEILPVGIVITLISAGILRRREILPA